MSDSNGNSSEMINLFPWLSYSRSDGLNPTHRSDMAALEFLERANEPDVEKIEQPDGTFVITPVPNTKYVGIGTEPLLRSLRSMSEIFGLEIIGLCSQGVSARRLAQG